MNDEFYLVGEDWLDGRAVTERPRFHLTSGSADASEFKADAAQVVATFAKVHALYQAWGRDESKGKPEELRRAAVDLANACWGAAASLGRVNQSAWALLEAMVGEET